uniref:Riboflavin kinase n=1 Tax=Cyprinus carpio TaxID=7962 RepID=A0A8C2KKE5_CYPCA
MRSLPYFCRGQVVRGFGRGSKDLGIPTANFPESVVDNLPADISTGIYYGWARVDNGDIHKMVMSIGWNPYYKNTKKSMETHVIHKFKEDFYGQMLSVAMVGYIRPERGFESLGKILSCSLELTPTSHDLTDATTPFTHPNTHSFSYFHSRLCLPPRRVESSDSQ